VYTARDDSRAEALLGPPSPQTDSLRLKAHGGDSRLALRKLPLSLVGSIAQIRAEKHP
jgi:hypothetical protein